MNVPSLRFEPLLGFLFASHLIPHRPVDSCSCVLIRQVSRLELCFEQSLAIWGDSELFWGQNSHGGAALWATVGPEPGST